MSSYTKILSNIDKKYLVQWNAISTPDEEILGLLNDLAGIIDELKTLNDNKKAISANIGKKKKIGEDIQSLLDEQQPLKKLIKDLKSKKTDVEHLIVGYFENETGDELPERFTHTAIQKDTSPAKVRIVSADTIDASIIDSYLARSSKTTPYHFSTWRKLFKSTFNHDDLSTIALDESKSICGLFPLTHFNSAMFGNFAVSIPYFNYGGPIADNENIENLLIEEAISKAPENNIEHIEIRELRKRDNFNARTDKVSMIRKLPDSTNAFSEEIGTKLRAQIKRSNDYRPQFKVGGLELLNDFYRVFSINMRDLGTPVYSKRFFLDVMHAWPNNSHFIVVYLDKKPVACAFVLGYKDILEIPWASALKTTNKIGINMFMYWNILNFAIDNNYTYFDFGRSSRDSGTFKFKQQWGAKPIQNYWNYWLPEGKELPQINPNNPKYKLLISCWKKLPVMASNLIGPHIVKNIP